MRLISSLLLIIAVIFGVSFAILNAEPVVVHYFLGVKQIPLSFLILGVWIFGIIVGLLAASFKILVLKMELRRVRRQKHAEQTQL